MATRRATTRATGQGAAKQGAAKRQTAAITGRMSAVGAVQRRRFLEVLTETSSVAAAAAAAGIAIDMLFRIRDADAGFAAAWRRALEIGYELIEGTLLAAARGIAPAGKIDVALARQLLAQRDARGGRAAGAASGGAGPAAGMQVKKVSLAEVEAEVLRLLGAGKPKA